MKIGFNVNKAINAYNQGTKVNTASVKKNENRDKIDISNEGREFLKYIDAANSTEINNKRVEEIQALLKQNKYEVDSEKLARSILNTIKDSDI
jgi:flagellar biosynthesis anti-sigma factor FlgM